MTSPLSLFLEDFGPAFGPPPGLAEAFPFEAEPDGPTTDEQVETARQEGYAAGEAAARAAAAARDAASEKAFDDRLEAARRSWTVETAGLLSAQFAAGLAAFEATVADTLAAALEPVLAEALRSRAVLEVRDLIGVLTAGRDALRVRVTGPKDLVEALLASGPLPAALDVVEAEAAELTVTAGDSTIRTELAQWGERFAATMGEAR